MQLSRNFFRRRLQSDPGAGDYTGNGTDEIGIYRFNSGLWAVSGLTRVYFGGANDLPVTR
ncbi:MAG: hypothetical protein V1789_12205 [PVC group bacterium]